MIEKERIFKKLEGAARRSRLNVKQFQSLVYEFYHAYGRRLPWRNTKNSYKIFVSEVMLQQTQADRVVPKYHTFLKQFPNWSSLAAAPLSEVLSLWDGLGYYRRARNLHRAAQEIVTSHRLQTPKKKEELCALPGVGEYTAVALRAFAFKIPDIMIETNIRSLFIHLFFKDGVVADKELAPLIEKTCDTSNPREWYYALMDLGAYCKETKRGSIQRSKSFTKQSRFIGSHRQVRAAVLRLIVKEREVKVGAVEDLLPYQKDSIREACKELIDEGFISQKGRTFTVR